MARQRIVFVGPVNRDPYHAVLFSPDADVLNGLHFGIASVKCCAAIVGSLFFENKDESSAFGTNWEMPHD
ncbi:MULTISPECIES: hypothetical protein [unclassified Comamonas]|uniref:hypothetical protein n=1 Tax=unclassified Comamonas TaxID=2638500 RepID=UPI0013CE8332|nr:hypothetical protein [Comamonas sp. lk]